MTAQKSCLLALVAAGLLGLGASGAETPAPAPAAGAPPSASGAAQWKVPAPEKVKAMAFAWLAAQQAGEATLAEAEALWAQLAEQPTEVDLLRCLAQTLALADENARRLVALCSGPKTSVILPPQAWLFDKAVDPLVAHNLRLWYGRWLVHEGLFDEALEALAGLEPQQVVAPATLLFYRSVAHYCLLDKEAGLRLVAQLLERSELSPRRYVALARLMEEDLQSLDEDSLDHIARRMGDVERRLGLGRAGKKVRDIEDGIIESLDKLIKRLEQQQGSGAGSGAGGGYQDNIRSSRPAPDSFPIGGKGPGEVERRPIGTESDWGNLPPKERDETLQRIGRDFPSHYRDVIEQYFRRLAEGTP